MLVGVGGTSSEDNDSEWVAGVWDETTVRSGAVLQCAEQQKDLFGVQSERRDDDDDTH